MADEVRRGLTAPLRSLPSKYFYDDRGSRLFEAITALPEYYQTRTEERILEAVADQVVARTRPRELVELGSGAGRKIGLLLEAMDRSQRAERLVLLDINRRFVKQAARRLGARYPGLLVRGLVADFTEDLSMLGPGGGRLVVFFAGTLGNLSQDEARRFLARVARHLEPGDALLVGADLVKDRGRLEAAYNDATGVTAEFNRNLLRHLNRALGADFEPDAFEHVAFWDEARQWIEMRLRASRACRVTIPAAELTVEFDAGEEIRTEISCKYTCQTFRALLPGTGLALGAWFTDPDRLFALALLERTGRGSRFS
jgi:L-histidine N-alpha-methyltransferase